jgi:chitosanase
MGNSMGRFIFASSLREYDEAMRHMHRASILVVGLLVVGPTTGSASGAVVHSTQNAEIEARGATPSASNPLSKDQKRRAEALTSLFESSSIRPCYVCVEVLADGRGVTAGRIGFTSATGDLVEVVERLTAARPGNRLAKFLPRLRVLATTSSGSVVGLEGIAKAWRRESATSDMKAVQDALYDEWYWQPTFDLAARMHVTSALGLAILGDSMVQHGEGSDPDGVPALVRRATAAAGGRVGTRITEVQWLRAFLRVRRADLAHAHNPETRAVWAESVTRVDALRQLLDDNQLELDHSITLHAGGYDNRIP